MQVKLIALDLDGTTLNSKGILTLGTRQVLEDTIDKGIHIVIATGRTYSALPEEILSIKGINYIVTSNGARVIDINTKDTLYSNLISGAAINNTVDLLRNFDFMIEAFIAGDAYIDRKIYENINVVGLNKKHSDYILNTRKPVENILDFLKSNNETVENININFGRQEDKQMMREQLKKLDDVTITSSFDHNLEIGGATTSKADAITHLCEKLGIDINETMAFGDSPNDETMLISSGFPIAMSNGKDQIKAIAKYVTGTNDEDGVAYAIKKFILK